ncbi:hypothetical protein [Pseudomonas sp. DP-17]|uniref:hypothetical protein n=1 Tax=Pseudomonas sp. DP-17 TaxID=1580486 RepID=UPI001EFAFAFC|nr:hypothetical protein [Pseudomonas sp. DP-17]MCG8906192.1 hypothetical protein [Pseudomonas sp. DP-17]
MMNKILSDLIDFEKAFPEYVFHKVCARSYFTERSTVQNYKFLSEVLSRAEPGACLNVLFIVVADDGHEVVAKNNFSRNQLGGIWSELSDSHDRLVLHGGCGRVIVFPDNEAWAIYEEVLEENGVLVVFNDCALSDIGLMEDDFVSRDLLVARAIEGVLRVDYIEKLITNYA